MPYTKKLASQRNDVQEAKERVYEQEMHIASLQKRIKALEMQVAAAEEGSANAEVRLEEAQSNASKLERQLKSRDEHLRLEGRKLDAALRDAKASAEDASKERSRANDQLNVSAEQKDTILELQRLLALKHRQLESVSGEGRTMATEVDALRKQNYLLGEALEKSRMEAAMQRDHQRGMEGEAKELSRCIQLLESENCGLQREASGSKKRIAELEALISKLQGMLASSHDELSELRMRSKDMESSLLSFQGFRPMTTERHTPPQALSMRPSWMVRQGERGPHHCGPAPRQCLERLTSPPHLLLQSHQPSEMQLQGAWPMADIESQGDAQAGCEGRHALEGHPSGVPAQDVWGNGSEQGNEVPSKMWRDEGVQPCFDRCDMQQSLPTRHSLLCANPITEGQVANRPVGKGHVFPLRPEASVPYATEQSVKEQLGLTKAMEDRIVMLSMEKGQLEAEYAKMPVHYGRSLSARRRREEVEARLDCVAHEISRIRLQLKQMSCRG
eukprot:evm.model.scf_824.2 EVM.evm.TU.scf_824.2   scf_824:40375-49612(+)